MILGSEKHQQEQRVLYKDYLTDAAALQSLSADFAVAAKRIDARSRVEAQKRDVATRFYEDFDAAIVEMKKLAEADTASVAQRLAEIDALAATARARSIEDKEIESLSARLRHAADAYGEAASVDMKKLAAAAAAVDSMNLDAAKSNLAAAESSLGATLRARSTYAEEMAREMRVLVGVEAALGSEDVGGLGARLREEANILEQRAVANMRDQLQYDRDAIEVLGKMAESASRAESAPNVESFRQDLGAVNRNVQNDFALDVRSQMEAISTHVKHADAIDMRLNNDFAGQLDALSRLAENKLYASMLGDAETFATQAKTLAQEVTSLDARIK
ncbi:MAG TPA: hypothetical protein VGK31_08135 [Thermoanaerobaculia bacterium]